MASFPAPLAVSLLLLTACGGQSSDETGAATDTTATTGSSASATGPGTGGAPSTGSTGGDPTTGSTGSTTGGGTATTGEDSESGDPGTTGGGLACTLDAHATAAVGALGAYEDCGTVDPWHDLAPAWQAAHDCALAAASEQRAFKLVYWLQGIDSEVGAAFVGLTAESYAVATFFYDGDPCGGGGCGPVVSQAYCEGLGALPECVVVPGEMCLTCAGVGPASQVCGPK